MTGGTGEMEFKGTADRVSAVSVIVNLVLSLLKLGAGIFARSDAMISDAVHSASDVLSTFIVIIGVHLAARESDRDHPYGHERLECVAAIVLAVILFLTGAGIGIKAVRIMLGGSYEDLPVPGMAALMAAVVSVIVKEAMYHYTARYARIIDSGALMADAWHHRSDALSSVGALVGIAGARLGFPFMDPLASLIICFFILKAALDIFNDAIYKMVDHACYEDTEKEMQECILSNSDVRSVDLLQTRVFGSKIYVDLEIGVEGSCTLREAHAIAEEVHDEIERCFPKVKHIMIHVNPYEDGLKQL